MTIQHKPDTIQETIEAYDNYIHWIIWKYKEFHRIAEDVDLYPYALTALHNSYLKFTEGKRKFVSYLFAGIVASLDKHMGITEKTTFDDLNTEKQQISNMAFFVIEIDKRRLNKEELTQLKKYIDFKITCIS
jgi:hypothetical protein